MKKFLAVLLLTLASVPVMAQHYHGGYRHHGHPVYYGGGGGWIAPLIIGGVVGAAIANRPLTTQTETVVVQPQPIIIQHQQNCTPWTETQNPDGTITRTRTCAQ